MLDTEKEASSILDEAAATLSLAYNLVKKGKVKEIIPALQKELLALRNEINTSAHAFDPAGVNALVTQVDMHADSLKSPIRLATTLGSATLDLACAKIRHATFKVSLANPWGMNKLAFDNLNKLADVLCALARDEERSS
jgi:cob(I)alamin adenosyltransferase